MIGAPFASLTKRASAYLALVGDDSHFVWRAVVKDRPNGDHWDAAVVADWRGEFKLDVTDGTTQHSSNTQKQRDGLESVPIGSLGTTSQGQPCRGCFGACMMDTGYMLQSGRGILSASRQMNARKKATKLPGEHSARLATINARRSCFPGVAEILAINDLSSGLPEVSLFAPVCRHL